jgi:hypothetical protein
MWSASLLRRLDHDKREKRRQRQARHRARLRRGEIIVPIEIGADVIDLLCRLGWLREHEADKAAIASAIVNALLSAK